MFQLGSTDYGSPMKPFFIEIPNFGRQFGQINFGAFGVFSANFTHFGTVRPLSIFSINQSLFLQKTKPLSQIFIWDGDLNLGRKELGT